MSRASKILESVELAQGIRVSVNPTTLDRALKDLRLLEPGAGPRAKYNLRLLGHLDSGDIFIWAAYDERHIEMARKLGIDFLKTITGESHETVYGPMVIEYVRTDDKKRPGYKKLQASLNRLFDKVVYL